MEKNPFEKLIVAQLVKKFPTFYGKRRFITVLTSVPCLARYESSPQYSHPIPLRFILILFYSLCVGLPSGLFPSDFSTKLLYAFLISAIRAICPSHLILFLSFSKCVCKWLPSYILVLARKMLSSSHIRNIRVTVATKHCPRMIRPCSEC
jgi:hypothetical protein